MGEVSHVPGQYGPCSQGAKDYERTGTAQVTQVQQEDPRFVEKRTLDSRRLFERCRSGKSISEDPVLNALSRLDGHNSAHKEDDSSSRSGIIYLTLTLSVGGERGRNRTFNLLIRSYGLDSAAALPTTVATIT